MTRDWLQALFHVVADMFGMSVGPDAEPLSLATELSTVEAPTIDNTQRVVMVMLVVLVL